MKFEDFLKLRQEQKKFNEKREADIFELECKIAVLQEKLEKARNRKFKKANVNWTDVIDEIAKEAAKKLGLIFETSGIYGIGAKHYLKFYSSGEKDSNGNFKCENLVKSVACTFDIAFDVDGNLKRAGFLYDTDKIRIHFPSGSLGAINGLGYEQKELPTEVDAFIEELNLKTN